MRRPDFSCRFKHCGASCALALFAQPGLAQDSITEETVDQAQTVQPEAARGGEGSAAPMAGQSDLVFAPIPISNPAIGTGLAGVAVLYYNPNSSPQPWSSGAGAGYTSTKSWFVGGYHKMALAHDRIRFLGVAGYARTNLDFYGIGADAGEAGLSVELKNKSYGGFADLQVQPFKAGFLRHLHAGARILFADQSTRVDLPTDMLPDFVPDSIELNSRIVMIGPSFTFDTLDVPLNPSKGVLVEGKLLYGADWLGSDFTHSRLDIGSNGFFRLGTGTVLGIRKQLCSASSDTPYYDLCMFGRGADLRGYEAGRYRDRASWALQAELRQHVSGKFGGVAFFGVGGIAASRKDIWKHSKVLTAGGLGVRYLASESANVNLRVDAAYGADGFAFYFGIGEAF